MRKLIFLAVLMICITNVTAVTLTPQKTTYSAGETLILTIEGDFQSKLTDDNIFFLKNNQEVPYIFSLIKFSNQKYILYSKLDAGNISIQVKNVLYKEEGILKGEPREITISTSSTSSSRYVDLINEIKNKTLSLEENAYSLISLSFDSSQSSYLTQTLLTKSKSNICWPLSSCKIKDTSLALLALSYIDYNNKNAIIDYLSDSENNLEIGSWSLDANIPFDSECNLTIANETTTKSLTAGDNSIQLDFSNQPDLVSVDLNCGNTPINSGKISHVYKGTTYSIDMNKTNEVYTVLNNQKCFGLSYRTACDSETTAMASYALDKAGQSTDTNWLSENSITTKTKAILYLLDKDSTSKNWLINNQDKSGFWSTRSLSFSTSPDTESTAYASLALQDLNEGKAGINWLNSQNIVSIKELAEVLMLSPADNIESIFSLDKGAFLSRINERIQFTLTNEGVSNKTIQISLDNYTESANIQPGESRLFSLKIPQYINNQEITNETDTAVLIEYQESLSWFSSSSELIYSIPVHIIPYTAPETNNILQPIPSKINITILYGTNTTIKLRLKNPQSQDTITYVHFEPSQGLYGLLSEDIQNITYISSGQEKEVLIKLFSKDTGEHEGLLSIISDTDGVNVPMDFYVTVTKDPNEVNIPDLIVIKENNTCLKLKGKKCNSGETCSGKTVQSSDTNSCCLGECKTSQSYSWIFLVIGVIILIGLIYYFIKKRKKPTEGQKALEQLKSIQQPNLNRPSILNQPR